MTKKRIDWIDNLKIIGILAVILGHIASPLGTFIYSWHMPLFFMIAGFFVKYNLSINDFIKKDFKRLMVPYFIFAMVGLVVETIKRIGLHREGLDYIHELKGIFIWMDMSSLINTYAFVLWFLPALFFARVSFVIINKYIKNIFFQFILISVFFSLSFMIELPFGLDNAMNALLFVFTGNVFFKYYQNITLLFIFPLIAVFLYFIYGIPSLDIASKNYEFIFLNIFFAFGVIYIMIQMLKKFNVSKDFFKTWANNTMLLFIIHPYTNNMAHIIVERLHFGDWFLKLIISLILLQIILFIKFKFNDKWIFKYV